MRRQWRFWQNAPGADSLVVMNPATTRNQDNPLHAVARKSIDASTISGDSKTASPRSQDMPVAPMKKEGRPDSGDAKGVGGEEAYLTSPLARAADSAAARRRPANHQGFDVSLGRSRSSSEADRDRIRVALNKPAEADACAEAARNLLIKVLKEHPSQAGVKIWQELTAASRTTVVQACAYAAITARCEGFRYHRACSEEGGIQWVRHFLQGYASLDLHLTFTPPPDIHALIWRANYLANCMQAQAQWIAGIESQIARQWQIQNQQPTDVELMQAGQKDGQILVYQAWAQSELLARYQEATRRTQWMRMAPEQKSDELLLQWYALLAKAIPELAYAYVADRLLKEYRASDETVVQLTMPFVQVLRQVCEPIWTTATRTACCTAITEVISRKTNLSDATIIYNAFQQRQQVADLKQALLHAAVERVAHLCFAHGKGVTEAQKQQWFRAALYLAVALAPEVHERNYLSYSLWISSDDGHSAWQQVETGQALVRAIEDIFSELRLQRLSKSLYEQKEQELEIAVQRKRGADFLVQILQDPTRRMELTHETLDHLLRYGFERWQRINRPERRDIIFAQFYANVLQRYQPSPAGLALFYPEILATDWAGEFASSAELWVKRREPVQQLRALLAELDSTVVNGQLAGTIMAEVVDSIADQLAQRQNYGLSPLTPRPPIISPHRQQEEQHIQKLLQDPPERWLHLAAVAVLDSLANPDLQRTWNAVGAHGQNNYIGLRLYNVVIEENGVANFPQYKEWISALLRTVARDSSQLRKTKLLLNNSELLQRLYTLVTEGLNKPDDGGVLAEIIADRPDMVQKAIDSLANIRGVTTSPWWKCDNLETQKRLLLQEIYWQVTLSGDPRAEQLRYYSLIRSHSDAADQRQLLRNRRYQGHWVTMLQKTPKLAAPLTAMVESRLSRAMQVSFSRSIVSSGIRLFLKPQWDILRELLRSGINILLYSPEQRHLLGQALLYQQCVQWCKSRKMLVTHAFGMGEPTFEEKLWPVTLLEVGSENRRELLRAIMEGIDIQHPTVTTPKAVADVRAMPGVQTENAPVQAGAVHLAAPAGNRSEKASDVQEPKPVRASVAASRVSKLPPPGLGVRGDASSQTNIDAVIQPPVPADESRSRSLSRLPVRLRVDPRSPAAVSDATPHSAGSTCSLKTPRFEPMDAKLPDEVALAFSPNGTRSSDAGVAGLAAGRG